MKDIIDQGDLEVVVAWGHPKGSEGGKKPGAMEDMKAMFRVCHALDARVTRVVGPSLRYRNDPHEPQLKALTSIFQDGAKMPEDEGAKPAVENHFDVTTDEFMDLIEDATREAIDVLGPGGGLILGPGCALGHTTPLDNIRALIETAWKHGVYNPDGTLRAA